MKWTLEIGKRQQEIADIEQLREKLLVAHRDAVRAPTIALINAPNGSRMAVGLGLERSVLNYIAPGGWPSRHAVDPAAGEGYVQYKLVGQETEVHLRGTVPVQDAINACLEFMRNGKIAEALQWQED
jgi:hypothetical protein